MRFTKAALTGLFICIGLSVSAQATVYHVNLSADPSAPNAGPNSGSYQYNPVTLQLDAGTYQTSVVGIAGGGLYDAYSVYAPTSNNKAFSDGGWSVAARTTTSTASAPRFNTAALALSYYGALTPVTCKRCGGDGSDLS